LSRACRGPQAASAPLSIISASASIPEARQKLSKLAVIFASALTLRALAGIAVDVTGLFMALLSFRGISTPSLRAQGEQRRSSYFNDDRDIAPRKTCLERFPHYLIPTWFAVDVSASGKPFQPLLAA
jgi:hypothetical protein